MAERAEGAIDLTCDSEAEAAAVEAALRPELGRDVPGSTARLERAGPRLSLRLDCDDAGALRAAVNSYLRWMRVAVEVHRVAQPPPARAGRPPGGEA